MYFKDDFCKGVKAVYFFLYFFCLKPSFFPRASVMLHARVPLTVALHAPEKKKTLKRAKHRRNLKSRESECARNAQKPDNPRRSLSWFAKHEWVLERHLNVSRGIFILFFFCGKLPPELDLQSKRGNVLFSMPLAPPQSVVLYSLGQLTMQARSASTFEFQGVRLTSLYQVYLSFPSSGNSINQSIGSTIRPVSLSPSCLPCLYPISSL